MTCTVRTYSTIDLSSFSSFHGRGVERIAVNVHFIDYGNGDVVSANELVMLDRDLLKDVPDLAEIPAQAVQCALAHVKPNPIRNPKGIWDRDVTE